MPATALSDPQRFSLPFDAERVDALLDALRRAALRTRAAARIDLFDACAGLALDRGAREHRAADVLLLCLPDALGQAPVLFRPGVAQRSFDEAWLLRLAERLTASDSASAAFLLRTRVNPYAQRQVAFLISALAEGRPLPGRGNLHQAVG